MSVVGGRYGQALRSSDLRRLVTAFLVDQAASWSFSVVLVAYVYGRTGSAAWITALASSRWIVGMLIAGYAGVLADRYDRGRLLTASAAASAAVTVGLVILVGTDAPIFTMLLGSMLLTITAAPTRSASGALVPNVVDEQNLIAANAIFAFLESLIVVLGPAVGGLLLLIGTPVWGVVLNAASFVVSGLLYSRLTVRSRGDAERGSSVFSQWAAGVSGLREHRKAFILTLFLALDSAAIGGAGILNAPLSVHLHGGTTGYSLLIATNAVGGIIAAGIANRLAGASRLAAVIVGAILLETLPLYLCVFAGWIAVASVLQIASGIGMVIVDVLAFTALQRELPREMLGRVLATVEALILGGTVLASFLASALYSVFGLAWALGVIGVGSSLLAFLGLPALRRVDREAAEAVAQLQPRIDVLERLDLFTGATRTTLELLAGSAQTESAEAGDVLIRQGDPADALWILLTGRLSVTVTEGGVTLPDVDAPGYVGELGLLHGAPRSATVRARESCQLLRIAGPDFLQALEAAPASASLMSLAGERLSRTTLTDRPDRVSR